MATNPTETTTELIDTGARRDTLGRIVTPSARRTELVAAWRQSGLTQAEFARREGLRYTTFAHWAQLGERKTKPDRSAVEFAEVRLPLPAPGGSRGAARLEVRLADGTVLSGNNATELAALVRAVRA